MNDGKTKKAQKHKNTTAFKIIFDTQALQKQKKVSLTNLCARCTQVMQWKLQYNKYKKMSQPARCNFCMDKNVFRTYMKACQSCAMSKNACAKCLTTDYQPPSQVKATQKDQKQQQRKEHSSQIQFMKTLQQRSRRTVRRGLQKGKISWDQKQEYFLDQEGNKINLHFRKGFTLDDEHQDNQDQNDSNDDDLGDDDQDAFGDQQQDDGLENQQDKKKGKSNNKQNKQTQAANESKTTQQKQTNSNQPKNASAIKDDKLENQDDIDLNDEDFQDQDQQEEEQIQETTNKKQNKKEHKKK